MVLGREGGRLGIVEAIAAKGFGKSPGTGPLADITTKLRVNGLSIREFTCLKHFGGLTVLVMFGIVWDGTRCGRGDIAAKSMDNVLSVGERD